MTGLEYMMRAITPDGGEVLAEGRVLHRGRRVATAEGSVRRASDGKLLAHGTSTCMILSPRRWLTSAE